MPARARVDHEQRSRPVAGGCRGARFRGAEPGQFMDVQVDQSLGLLARRGKGGTWWHGMTSGGWAPVGLNV
jgi:hypothetical protein